MKQSKLKLIEILIVSQLPTLHSESSNMFQGGLAIFSIEQGEIMDLIPPWVRVFPNYHLWIRFLELQAANLLEAWPKELLYHLSNCP